MNSSGDNSAKKIAGQSVPHLKNGPIPASFVYFRPFLITISIIQIKKSVDVCLGLEPTAAGW